MMVQALHQRRAIVYPQAWEDGRDRHLEAFQEIRNWLSAPHDEAARNV